MSHIYAILQFNPTRGTGDLDIFGTRNQIPILGYPVGDLFCNPRHAFAVDFERPASETWIAFQFLKHDGTQQERASCSVYPEHEKTLWSNVVNAVEITESEFSELVKKSQAR